MVGSLLHYKGVGLDFQFLNKPVGVDPVDLDLEHLEHLVPVFCLPLDHVPYYSAGVVGVVIDVDPSLPVLESLEPLELGMDLDEVGSTVGGGFG